MAYFRLAGRCMRSIPQLRSYLTAPCAFSIQQLVPVLEKRTWELMQCFERRQAERGVVDVTEAFYHWAHDFMVSRRHIRTFSICLT